MELAGIGKAIAQPFTEAIPQPAGRSSATTSPLNACAAMNQVAKVTRQQTREYLLESLVNPSARLAQGFEIITVATRDGEVIDGTKLKETDGEISLRLASGEIRKLARKEIERQTASSVSAMPPMAEVLTPLEIRDLVAYLATLK